MSNSSPDPAVSEPPGSMEMAAPVNAQGGMYTAAAIINWVTLLGWVIVSPLTLFISLITAAWFIPMTILIHRGAKGPYKHTSLGVCTLLFCNIISGILMLVADSARPAKPHH